MTYMTDGKPTEGQKCEFSVGDAHEIEGDGFETVYPKLEKRRVKKPVSDNDSTQRSDSDR